MTNVFAWQPVCNISQQQQSARIRIQIQIIFLIPCYLCIQHWPGWVGNLNLVIFLCHSHRPSPHRCIYSSLYTKSGQKHNY